jgi:hypothetical protein
MKLNSDTSPLHSETRYVLMCVYKQGEGTLIKEQAGEKLSRF